MITNRLQSGIDHWTDDEGGEFWTTWIEFTDKAGTVHRYTGNTQHRDAEAAAGEVIAVTQRVVERCRAGGATIVDLKQAAN